MGISGFHSMPLLVGNLNSYTKNMEMNQKFEQRKENPNLTKEEEKIAKRERDLIQFREDSERIREGDKISSLDVKLKSGGELTDEELEYLKEKNPELYKKAIEAKRERQRYKKELENCRTKEDVEKLHARKMQEFTAEVKSIKSNPNIPEGKKTELIEQICRRFMGVMTEHTKFIKSDAYANLPDDEEDGKKKGRKKSVDPGDESVGGGLEVKLRIEFQRMNVGDGESKADGDVGGEDVAADGGVVDGNVEVDGGVAGGNVEVDGGAEGGNVEVDGGVAGGTVRAAGEFAMRSVERGLDLKV